MSKKISIIIVTYNSELLIFDCLDSIIKYNDIGKNLEIIIVDNNSQNVDLMFTSIREKFGDEIILIKNDKNGGYGQGNNVGIGVASSPIIMIMNPDVRLLEPVFKYVLNAFKSSDVVMVGMQQLITNNRKGQSLLYMDNTVVGLIKSKIYSFFNIFKQNEMCFSGSCFFVDKNKFFEIGLFDENIFMYGEELDIHKRFVSNSKDNKMIFYKHLKYIHMVNDRQHSFNLEKQQFNSFIYLCKKYNMDIIKECKKRIRIYKFLKYKNILLNNTDNIIILDNSIKLFRNFINSNER